jgi:hypothetical protein
MSEVFSCVRPYIACHVAGIPATCQDEIFELETSVSAAFRLKLMVQTVGMNCRCTTHVHLKRLAKLLPHYKQISQCTRSIWSLSELYCIVLYCTLFVQEIHNWRYSLQIWNKSCLYNILHSYIHKLCTCPKLNLYNNKKLTTIQPPVYKFSVAKISNC